MLFVIHALDKADVLPQRMAHYDAHKAFLADHARWGVKIVMSGPLTTDDGVTPVGSHFVIEAPARETVETFHQADPFYTANIWGKATITVFVKRHG